MNFRILSPDAFGRVDPPVMRFLSRLPQGNEVVVVPITRLENFVCNGSLLHAIGARPWVLVDFAEFGWDWNQQSSYLWGRDRLDHEWFKGGEWHKLDDFIRENPPVVTFQRELLAKDATDKVRPIEYLNYAAPVAADTEDQFNTRPISVLYNWGRSSESRPTLHGDIFKESGRYGYEVCSQWDHIERTIREVGGSRQIWCAIHTPHFARVPVEETQRWMGKAKIVVSLGGCGKKTFRKGEVNNSVIAMQPDKLAWSVNIRGVRLREGEEVLSLSAALSSEFLYRDYTLNHAAADALRPERYIPEYFIPAIQKLLS